MKLTSKQLRSLIREEYLRGVPEFAFKEETRKFVEGIRQQLKRHILMTKENPITQRQAFETSNGVLERLEDETNDLLERVLWQFMQNT